VADEDERSRRLELNRQVVREGRAPSSVPTGARYGSYWLVAARADDPPPSAALVYANERFELYRLGRASTFR